MKKLLTTLFYLVAFAAVSYFLREYLHAPKAFIISLIISLGIVVILAAMKSKFLRPLGIFLLASHTLWLIGIFIPVYNSQPDIRQRYRRAPNSLGVISADNVSGTDTRLTLLSNGQSVTSTADTFPENQPLYQGDEITTAGSDMIESSRFIARFWDGSDIQIFPQSHILISTLAPDFGSVSGSALGIELLGGIATMHTRRDSYLPEQRYTHAGNISFSCQQCIISFSGRAGAIYSSGSFTRRTSGGQQLTISGGTYAFSNTRLSAANTGILTTLFGDSERETNRWVNQYNDSRQEYITRQRGRTMDTSALLTYVSKTKMALVGLIDWTYLEKYEYLGLYEYMRGISTDAPSKFDDQVRFFSFIQ